MTVDKQRILHACRHNLPIIITSYKLPRETEMAIEETLSSLFGGARPG
jgi:hypothetical protein